MERVLDLYIVYSSWFVKKELQVVYFLRKLAQLEFLQGGKPNKNYKTNYKEEN